jgi:hypothetical protein
VLPPWQINCGVVAVTLATKFVVTVTNTALEVAEQVPLETTTV